MFINDMTALVSTKFNNVQEQAKKETYLWKILIKLGTYIEDNIGKSIKRSDYISDINDLENNYEYYQQFLKSKSNENKIELKDEVKDKIISKNHILELEKELSNSNYVKALSIRDKVSIYTILLSSIFLYSLNSIISETNIEYSEQNKETNRKISEENNNTENKKRNAARIIYIILALWILYLTISGIVSIDGIVGIENLIHFINVIVGVPILSIFSFIICIMIIKFFDFLFDSLLKESIEKNRKNSSKKLKSIEEYQNKVKNKIKIIENIKEYQKKGKLDKAIELIEYQLQNIS